MTTQEMIAVMRAHDEGKPIEYKIKDREHTDWALTNDPQWAWDRLDYRIKPQPGYVPYETGEEFIQDVMKHKGWVMIKEENEEDCCYYPLGAFCTCDGGVDVISSNPPEDWKVPFDNLLAIYVWADDKTPCGKLKGGNL